MRELATAPSGTRDAVNARVLPEEEMPAVLGYELVRPLGRGGMGMVWEAHEPELDRRVALKVLLRRPFDGRGENAWSEARLAARIAHPGIVPVHDVGVTLDGRPYYTMDLIAGTSLDVLLADGALPVARALAIGAQICSAVSAAHDAGVVHRDLKPANVMIDPSGKARILDFGLAEELDLPEVEKGDWAGGTLSYMAPEHLEGKPPTAANDLYAIGVILYEMLTGCLPFDADSQRDLINMVLAQPAPPFSLLPAQPPEPLHPDLERTCLRCLEKKPSQRFGSARALEHVLEGLSRGRTFEDLVGQLDTTPPPSSLPLAPQSVLPLEESREGAVHFRWAFQLDAAPEALWPYVANTDRFNRAVGLPPVDYQEPPADGMPVRVARTRAMGMALEWEEHPFEWVRHREHRVYRKYQQGALAALWNEVKLAQNAQGGTDLVHEVWVRPRGLLGRLAVRWQVGRRLAQESDRIYRHIAQVAKSRDEAQSAFADGHTPSAEQRLHVETGAARLRRSGRFGHALIDRLVKLLLSAPDAVVERIQPHALADEWQVDRALLLELLLHAVDAGLLRIGWDLVCPQCAVPHAIAGSLRDVASTGSCVACRASYDRDLASTVELRFRPDPAVRDVASATYCIGAPALRPHTLAQQTLAPRETRILKLKLAGGPHRVVAGRPARSFPFHTSMAAYADTCLLRIDEHGVTASPGLVRLGEVSLVMTNATEAPQLMRVDDLTARTKALTAAEALTHPSFQALMRAELLPLGEHVTVGRLAFLAVDVADRHALLDTHGDPAFFELTRKLSSLLVSAAEPYHGVLASTGVDELVATFPRGASAVSAALALRTAAQTLPLGARVRMAVHEGRCIAFTQGDRVSYFGQTLARAVSLLGDAPPGGIALTTAVTDDPAAVAALYGAAVPSQVAVSAHGPYAGRRITKIV